MITESSYENETDSAALLRKFLNDRKVKAHKVLKVYSTNELQREIQERNKNQSLAKKFQSLSLKDNHYSS